MTAMTVTVSCGETRASIAGQDRTAVQATTAVR